MGVLGAKSTRDGRGACAAGGPAFARSASARSRRSRGGGGEAPPGATRWKRLRQRLGSIPSSLVFSDATVETARSAKSVKRAEGEPPGDGGASSWEDKRGRASTA